MIVVASIALAVWLYLLLARGAFWRCAERDDWAPARPVAWPRVAAVVPARNEAECIGESIGSLLAQDYPGAWTVILVDDDSNDGTADIARRGGKARRAAAGGDKPRLAGGMDRQALGREAGHRRGDGPPAAAGLSAPHRRRHRARARFRHAGWSRMPRPSAWC